MKTVEVNKEIEKYIKFGIENGFQLDAPFKIDRFFSNETIRIRDTIIVTQGGLMFFYPITEVIGSKEFIQSIARGVSKDIKKESVREGDDVVFNTFDKFGLIHRKDDNMKNGIIREVTTRQAIAIRDNTLDEYIKNLLKNGN